ncbi:MAG: antibiotic biosynthesis monooxygenase [Rhodobacteraceae bacterium]|nr:antibiotic biosynthesis monooxygenase [Paracoccaceae bacterium]
MHVVIFELKAKPGQQGVYLDTAANLRPILKDIDGFLGVERFESLTEPGKILSLSFWRDQDAIKNWRNAPAHRKAQHSGRKNLFEDYRLSVARIERQYGLSDRAFVPNDNLEVHDQA